MPSSPINRAFGVALACGALPLLSGVSLFVLWVITRWDWLIWAGLFTLYVGTACFVIGAISLVRFWWLASGASNRSRWQLLSSALGCAALLISNFPAAGGIIAAAIAIETRYTVVVHNASHQSVTDVRVQGGGCDVRIDTIPPGGVAQRSFWIKQDGSLEFFAINGPTKVSTTIEGYVTGGMGGHRNVNIDRNGTLSVSD